jgi:transposase-like protein
MKAKGRRYRKPEEWREIIKRQQESGLTVKDFCVRESIHENGFYKWRQKLRIEAPVVQPRFVELNSACLAGGAPVRVELQLPNGAILRIA